LLEEELLQVKRLDSLGRLAGGVAHDFNNLLTGILAHAEFARDAADDAATVREELNEVETTARRAADLTRQLLTFARRERIAPTAFDVNARLQSLSRLLGRVVGDGVHLETEFASRPLAILADGGQFEQAVVNLVVNARDAMANGGTVTIGTALVASADGLGGVPAVRITVADTGIGMDEATRSRIFEPFFTTKQGGRGTGLGLASVYGTVTQAGGVITVASAPGEGTRFDLIFPEHQGRIATPPSEPLADASTIGRRPAAKVLVAEDDELVRRVVVKLLHRHGFQVVEAVDGEDGLAHWRRTPDAFDLVLTDVQMPCMNGRAMAREMTRERPTQRVAYMSGYDADAVAAVPDAPEGPFVAKPFSESELLEGVRRALA
jgi:CheY-like chemotaxis protein